MDNLTLNLQRNRTISFCSGPYKIINSVLNIILLFFSFPTTVVIIVKLLNKMYKTKSFSAAEIFLLQISFTNVFLFILLLFLDYLHVVNFSSTLYILFYSPTITARPIFLLATCVIFYLAIVHPVTYMATKTWLHWEWLVITPVWIGALAVNADPTFHKFNFFHPFFAVGFFINLPITMFFNITTLRALSSRGSGNDNQTLNPSKRKAFRIILSIQVFLLMYYMPRAYSYTYLLTLPMDRERFLCSEGLVIMTLPIISEFAMPVIYTVYSN